MARNETNEQQKQIDEMAKILYENERLNCEIVDAVKISTALYNAGYRQRRDTVKEIIAFLKQFEGYANIAAEELEEKYLKEREG